MGGRLGDSISYFCSNHLNLDVFIYTSCLCVSLGNVSQNVLNMLSAYLLVTYSPGNTG